MYTLRTYTNDGVETNQSLGNLYQVFEYHRLTEGAFKSAFKDVYQEEFNPEKHETRAIIVGNITHCLTKGDKAYIMTENGKTLATVRAIDSALSPERSRVYTEADLVSFGNFLLTDERAEGVDKHIRNVVHDADIQNWAATRK